MDDIAEMESLMASEQEDSGKKDKAIETSFVNTPEYLVEQIMVQNGESRIPMYLRYDKETGKVKQIRSFEYGDKLYKPVDDEIFQKGGVKLPTGIQEFKNTKEIIDQIRDFLIRNCELPKMYEGLLPNLVLFYWLYDKFPFIPYVGFVGGTGTGKTTAMMDFGSLCYKPIDTTGSLTIASLFRTATMWKGTLLIDEFYTVGDSSKEIVAFLKAGVSDRLVIRTEGEKKKQLNAYVVKSPKMFTSEKAIDDAGLNSRTLFVKMQKNTRKVPLYRLDHYYKEAEEIRNKLLLWRFKNYDKINLYEIEYGFEELAQLDGRTQQILTPIYYFSDNETKESILEFAKEQEEDMKRERRESLSGAIFEIMCTLWDSEQEATLKEITEVVNERRKNEGYKTNMTERRIGQIIRKEIGFETKRMGHENITTVIRDITLEENKRNYFDIPINETIKRAKEIFATDATQADVPADEKIPF